MDSPPTPPAVEGTDEKLRINDIKNMSWVGNSADCPTHAFRAVSKKGRIGMLIGYEYTSHSTIHTDDVCGKRDETMDKQWHTMFLF